MSNLTPDERLQLTRRIMDLLEDWGLSGREMAAILCLPESVKVRSISRFRDDQPFPDDPAVNRRVAYLMRIEEALNTYFPRNPGMRALWMKRGNRQFGSQAPLAVILDGGEKGLVSVLSHLDCTFAWDLTGSKSEYSLRAGS
jgi:hypothetical protein